VYYATYGLPLYEVAEEKSASHQSVCYTSLGYIVDLLHNRRDIDGIYGVYTHDISKQVHKVIHLGLGILSILTPYKIIYY